MSHQIYFSSKEAAGRVTLCIVVYEGYYQFPSIFKEEEMPSGATFYENETRAMILALEKILEEGYDDVVLLNQNQLLFDWLSKKSHDNPIRDMNYREVRKLFMEIVSEGIQVKSMKIKGKNNVASKELKKHIGDGEIMRDLSELFGDVEIKDNVVDFKKKAE